MRFEVARAVLQTVCCEAKLNLSLRRKDAKRVERYEVARALNASTCVAKRKELGFEICVMRGDCISTPYVCHYYRKHIITRSQSQRDDIIFSIYLIPRGLYVYSMTYEK